MPYLVDGHNLIPHIPGLKLSDADDEIALLQILGRFASQRRAKLEVYFDRAASAQEGSRSYGLVRAWFISRQSSADEAIKQRLARLGRSARNWTVVTSDRDIITEARSFHSKVLTSPEFSAILQKLDAGPGPGADNPARPEISPEDLAYWMEQFGKD